VGIVRISAAEWGVLKRKKANRLVDRMARYVPEGIVGIISLEKTLS
jgi:branched-subunit amino acid transport protein AzlD